MIKSNSRKKISGFILFFVASFVLHLVWENFQAPLFEGFSSFGQHFPRCLFATATGDMIFMLIIYLSLAIAHKNFWWVNDRRAYTKAATWFLPVLIGVLIAVGFELWAVYVDHRWVYGSMPLIPFVKVGLTPVLQMILVPLAVIGWMRRFAA